MEIVLAESIGMKPEELFPDRYSPEGLPLKYAKRLQKRDGG